MSKYIPKTTIDEYIDKSELNSRIYQTLLYLQDSTANGRHKLKRQPLEIFNQAYTICEELQAEKHPEERQYRFGINCVIPFYPTKRA